MCSIFPFVSYLGKSHCCVKTVKQMQKKRPFGAIISLCKHAQKKIYVTGLTLNTITMTLS